MFAVGPLCDGRVESRSAALGLRIAGRSFHPDPASGSLWTIGETYAFDRNGLLLSQSRFDDDLKQLGLLVDQLG